MSESILKTTFFPFFLWEICFCKGAIFRRSMYLSQSFILILPVEVFPPAVLSFLTCFTHSISWHHDLWFTSFWIHVYASFGWHPSAWIIAYRHTQSKVMSEHVPNPQLDLGLEWTWSHMFTCEGAIRLPSLFTCGQGSQKSNCFCFG